MIIFISQMLTNNCVFYYVCVCVCVCDAGNVCVVPGTSTAIPQALNYAQQFEELQH